jgi:PKD repeat protein
MTSQDYAIEANLTHDSDGVWHDPALGHVPDDIPVTYAVTPGTGSGFVFPTTAGTAAGVSQSIFTSTQAGTATVSATVDSQTVSALIERPIAAFTAEDMSVVRQLQEARFIDQSISSLPLTYAWDFGDGGTSADQNPPHVYKKEDVYTVTLTVSNSLGHDTITKENFIFATPPNPLKANFMGENKTGGSPLEVQFTDHSMVSVKIPSYPDIDSWYWEFGDGTTSTQKNPNHTYQDAGNYHVTLTVSNSVDNDSKTKDFIIVTKKITVTKDVPIPKKIFIRLM